MQSYTSGVSRQRWNLTKKIYNSFLETASVLPRGSTAFGSFHSNAFLCTRHSLACNSKTKDTTQYIKSIRPYKIFRHEHKYKLP